MARRVEQASGLLDLPGAALRADGAEIKHVTDLPAAGPYIVIIGAGFGGL